MKRLLIMMVLFGQVLVTSSAFASLVTLGFDQVTPQSLPLTYPPPPQPLSIPSLAGPVNFLFYDGFDSANVTATTTVSPNGISGTNNNTDPDPLNWLNGVITADFTTTNTGLAGNLVFNYVLSGFVGSDSQALQIDFYLRGVPVKHVDVISSATTNGVFTMSLYGLQTFDKFNIQTTADAGVYQFNDIQYEAVPEPSTYALLVISLGVVGFARKRMTSKEV